jgi:fructose-specific phosphotransferase system component IIB
VGKKMKIDEIKICVHNLINKIVIVDSKLKKTRRLSNQEDVNVEIDKAIKNSDLALAILTDLKALLIEE